MNCFYKVKEIPGFFHNKLILLTLANEYYLYPKEIILNIEVNDIEHYVFSYTGHEHLLEFKIINMNGRMYDPVLGRMLSPDNYVQGPNNPQNYNRYTYCLNNPLIYTDPTGEKWWHWGGGADILTGGAILLTVSTTGLTAYGAMFPMTNQFYEVQKYVSPVAFKSTFGFGSLQNGIGFDMSLGMLKGSNGYRYNYGTTYYWSNYGGYNG